MSDTNPSTPPTKPEQESHPLRSVYTSNFPDLLEQLGISLVVTTYQAGKVILVRKDGETLNTHFVNYQKPMGMAVNVQRMAIGSGSAIWILHNMPTLAARLEPAGKHDGCFLHRRTYVTGDIDIHEMGWGAGDELWFINTRFSALCTLDEISSFNPRWKPPFISALAPEDRCHLNGLGMQNGKPKYVTLLGQTDTAGGWRENKRNGGLLMDVETNRVLLTELSMPHSPRLYDGELWLLESGEGGLARVDLRRQTWQNIALLPGFTRGIDFAGPLAFIGLSKVRESAVFSGIPLVERLEERTCGVWVVNIQNGQTIAFLRFEEGVQEIFSVQVVRARYPALLDHDDEHLKNSYMLPDEAMRDVKLPG